MRKAIFLSVFLCLTLLSLLAQTKEEMVVRSLLTEQTRLWNKGDIRGFMSGYWNNDSLLFIGKSGVNYGWQKTLLNYQKHYPDTAAMGKLHFELMEVKQLSAMYFFVIGKWYLTRSAGNIDGAFTLLLRKIHNKWVIVADHSS